LPTARWWKDFYAAERVSLGERGMESLFQSPLSLRRRGVGGEVFPSAIIFPHTKLSASGPFTAAAANAVIESDGEVVLALGVLHLGDRRGNGSLRGIHGPGAPYDKGIWREEFSLDNFEAMLETAARRAGKRMPKLIARYPFLTGEDPESLPGFDEAAALISGGAAMVATADIVHHGAGYGTPVEMRLARENPGTKEWARYEIEAQLSALARKDFSGFLSHCKIARSDFRDAGPVLAALLPSATQSSILDVTLVNYSDVLDAEEPTWVAAALAQFRQAEASPTPLS